MNSTFLKNDFNPCRTGLKNYKFNGLPHTENSAKVILVPVLRDKTVVDLTKHPPSLKTILIVKVKSGFFEANQFNSIILTLQFYDKISRKK